MTLLAAAAPAGTTSIATPTLWVVTLAGIVALLAFDLYLTHRPHEVSMREAISWTVFYLALPLIFGVWLWMEYGGRSGLEYYTGYLVEKSLSVDNLFVFILILGAFAVPRELRQRVLMIGIIGALILRGIFIAVGAQLISMFAITFLFFGLILLVTGAKLLKDALKGEDHAETDVDQMPTVRLVRRLWPVSSDYQGTKLFADKPAGGGRRALTPLGLTAVVVLLTDVVFAVDSVPAVYGITGDPYLVFVTNAFALLGLRALYFVLEGALGKLVHLNYGLSIILGFIGVKLVMHWAHGIWPVVPEIPIVLSLVVIVGVLVVVTVTSLLAVRKREREESPDAAERS